MLTLHALATPFVESQPQQPSLNALSAATQERVIGLFRGNTLPWHQSALTSRAVTLHYTVVLTKTWSDSEKAKSVCYHIARHDWNSFCVHSECLSERMETSALVMFSSEYMLVISQSNSKSTNMDQERLELALSKRPSLLSSKFRSWGGSVLLMNWLRSMQPRLPRTTT